jgi:hypothetical protein
MSPRIRDRIKGESYFQAAIDAELSSIERYQALSAGAELPVVTRSHYKLAAKQVRIILHRYSRGEAVDDLPRYFAPMLDAWEAAERSAAHLWSVEQQHERHDWAHNLDFYIISFWLVGLALAFEVDDGQWARLLALIGNEGNDRLLDLIIASRTPERPIGTRLRHATPYARLLTCIDAGSAERPALLSTFLDRWYVELGRRPAPPAERREVSEGEGRSASRPQQTGDASGEAPYWHGHHLLDGGYFGYWCLEAVAAVKAFGIDDTTCRDHRHYPGDLLRRRGMPIAEVVSTNPEVAASSRPPRLARWFGRR